MKFYYKNITINVPESVYYPEEDTMMLINQIENTMLNGKKVLEIGCGSGIISILAAIHGATVTACDIDPAAVKTTAENAVQNSADVKTVKSDMFSQISGTYDIIVFNAPYLPDEEHSDKTFAGGPTGKEDALRFIIESKNHLNSKGIIFLVVSTITGEECIKKEMQKQYNIVEVVKEKIPWEEIILIKAQLKYSKHSK